MRNSKCILLALILFLSFSFVTRAQRGETVEIRDLETWSAFEVNYNLNKKWAISLEEQIRLDNNSSEISGFLTQLSTSYKLLKKLKIALGLRVTNKNDNTGKIQGYNHFFRFQLDAILTENIKRFTFKYRLRYQNRNEIGLTFKEGDISKESIRLKVKMIYDIKKSKMDPSIAAEIFNFTENGINRGLSDFRITIGTSYRLKKRKKLGIYYRIEKELNTENPKVTNIFNVEYSYTLKHKKNKEDGKK